MPRNSFEAHGRLNVGPAWFNIFRLDVLDSRNCEKTPCRIERIERIERIADVTGPLSDEQRQRLLVIAERCPVHRTLIGEVQIVTRLDRVGS